MKFTTTLLASSAIIGAGTLAFADAHADMAKEMTLVSWGGAYQASQDKAYLQPYLEMHPELSAVWDESSNEAVAKLRAMNEAGNVTWDLVDVVAADAIRLCDEGLAMEIDADEMLAEAPDGTSAEDDFGDLLVSDCFIPQIVYSTTFGYRTDMVGDTPPTKICDVFDTEAYPGKRALEKRPVSTEKVEQCILSLKSQLRATGEREVSSELLGNLIMKALKELDKVAYVRFASVYRSFEDIREFGEEIARLGD